MQCTRQEKYLKGLVFTQTPVEEATCRYSTIVYDNCHTWRDTNIKGQQDVGEFALKEIQGI